MEVTTIDTAGNDFTLTTGTTSTGDAQNIVMGHTSNLAGSGVDGATVSGGGYDDGSTIEPNWVVGNYATVGGGRGNIAGNRIGDDPTEGELATVGGGFKNIAKRRGATVGGGTENLANGEKATIAGGENNKTRSERGDQKGYAATVAGGGGNTASGDYAVIPGGANNTADGNHSFAAGRRAETNGYDGAFVLADSSSTAITAQRSDEVRSQMPIYAPSFNTTSARSAKTDFATVDPQRVLDGVAAVSIQTWAFDHQDDGRHMGPMAGEFAETFGLGTDDRAIASVDADGVALAAIQGLAERLEQQDERIEALEAGAEQKDGRITELEAETEQLRSCNDELEARLAAVEERLANLEADHHPSAPVDDCPVQGHGRVVPSLLHTRPVCSNGRTN